MRTSVAKTPKRNWGSGEQILPQKGRDASQFRDTPPERGGPRQRAIPRATRGSARRKFDLRLRPNFAARNSTNESKITTLAYATKSPNDEPRQAEVADTEG